MKTMMTVLMLLISTSVLAAPPSHSAAAANANCHASFTPDCVEDDATYVEGGAVDKVYSIPEPGTLALIGLGMVGLVVARTRKR